MNNFNIFLEGSEARHFENMLVLCGNRFPINWDKVARPNTKNGWEFEVSSQVPEVFVLLGSVCSKYITKKIFTINI